MPQIFALVNQTESQTLFRIYPTKFTATWTLRQVRKELVAGAPSFWTREMESDPKLFSNPKNLSVVVLEEFEDWDYTTRKLKWDRWVSDKFQVLRIIRGDKVPALYDDPTCNPEEERTLIAPLT